MFRYFGIDTDLFNMKRLFILTLAVVTAVCPAFAGPKLKSSMKYKYVKGQIVLETPKRAKGQTSALGLTAEPIENVRVGFVGIGNRGSFALTRYLHIDGAVISALCDKRQEAVDKGNKFLQEQGLSPVPTFVGEDAYKELCESDLVDLIYIATGWQMHTPIAVYAMEHGKHVAIEVPSATSVEECWQLVNTCEKTRKHCMMLENCCYDFYEMTALNMARQGVFGEVYHAEGAYIHTIYDHWGNYTDNWRQAFNQSHGGDNYPTHGLGPCCQVMDIHRSDLLDVVVSQDTKSIIGLQTAKEQMGVDSFAEGDHVVSLIRTQNGHQIEIQHNVYSLRPYSRMYALTGTKGYATKYPDPKFAIEPNPRQFLSVEEYKEVMEKYKHPIIREYEEKARKVGGHGGMDYIMDARLIYCLQKGLPLDMDVYDLAEWCALGELSDLSIQAGCMPVKYPDFTRGDWKKK